MKYIDPYDDMSDDEFEGHMLKRLSKPESVSVSIRMPKGLLGRIKAVAGSAKQPYQRLMKGILEDAIERLERRPLAKTARRPPAARATRRTSSRPKRTTSRRAAATTERRTPERERR